MNDNLAPGTTDAMIEAHFGGPELTADDHDKYDWLCGKDFDVQDIGVVWFEDTNFPYGYMVETTTKEFGPFTTFEAAAKKLIDEEDAAIEEAIIEDMRWEGPDYDAR